MTPGVALIATDPVYFISNFVVQLDGLLLLANSADAVVLLLLLVLGILSYLAIGDFKVDLPPDLLVLFLLVLRFRDTEIAVSLR